MKRFFILIIVIFIPFVVYAEECGTNSIVIESVDLLGKTENVEEVSPVSFQNNKLNMDLKMFDVGDYIEYKLLLKNTSNDDYYFDKKSLNIDSKYLIYNIDYIDDSNIIPANSEKSFSIKIQYNSEVNKTDIRGGKYTFNDNNTLHFSEKSSTIIDLIANPKNIIDAVKNPETRVGTFALLLFLLIFTIIVIIILKKKKVLKYYFMMIGLIVIVPTIVQALCRCDLDVDFNITISKLKPNPCYFDGEMIQGAEYTDGTFVYKYKQQALEEFYQNTYSAGWDVFWKDMDLDGWGVRLEEYNGKELNAKTCSSINGKPIVSMSYIFSYLYEIEKLDVSEMDVSNVVNLKGAFQYVGQDSLSGLKIVGFENWDVSRVKDMSWLFYLSASDTSELSIEGLDNWDTSNVEDMTGVFSYLGSSVDTFDIGDLSNWDTSSANTMESMFEYAGNGATNFNNIGDLSDWNVSNVTNMRGMFSSLGAATDNWSIGDLSNWDVSNVTDISAMFSETGGVDNEFYFGDLSNWDVSNVTNMSWLFSDMGKNAKRINIGNLSNWNTRKVDDMINMFRRAGNDETVWQNVGTLNIYNADISYMFKESSSINIIVNMHNNLERYIDLFSASATTENSGITVNYSESVSNIDAIINTKSNNSKVIKGSLIE